MSLSKIEGSVSVMPLVHRYLHDAIDYAVMVAAELSLDHKATIEWAGKTWALSLEPMVARTSRGSSYIVHIDGQDMGMVWENELMRGKKIAHRMEMFGLLAKVGDK
jgi:hypothetical protein